MIQENNLYEGMRQFFRRLPDHYIITAEEQIELIWWPPGKNQPSHRECFPDLKQASQRAISLGPAHHIVLQAVIEPGTAPWNSDSTQVLAMWGDAPGMPGSNGITTGGARLHPLLLVEPSQQWVEYFSDGVTTCCEASWFYYRSRCPIRAQIEQKRQQEEGD
jgi:hypothetical protein